MKPPQISENEITALRDKINLYIDAIVEKQKVDCPRVPAGVIRNILTSRSNGCHCQAALNLLKEDVQ